MVVSSLEIERRLGDLYYAPPPLRGAARSPDGDRRTALVGDGHLLSDGAVAAAKHALEASSVRAEQLEVLIYGGRLPRALRAGDGLPGGRRARRRPGRRGLRRQQRLPGRAQRDRRHRQPDRTRPDPRRDGRLLRNGPRDQRNHDRADAPTSDDGFLQAVAGHADRRLGRGRRAADRRLVFRIQSGAGCSAGSDARRPSFTPSAAGASSRSVRRSRRFQQFTATDSSRRARSTASSSACRPGRPSCKQLGWVGIRSTRSICHQVGSSHRDTILKSARHPGSKEFSTYPYLGQHRHGSLPLTAASGRGPRFLEPGDRVAFLGIGSGLNCLMLGVEW